MQDYPTIPNTRHLLGPGLKFYTASPIVRPSVKNSMIILVYRIHTKQYLNTNGHSSSMEYMPQIYVKLKGWNPPPASLTIENQLTIFEQQLKNNINISNKKQQ